MGLFQALAVSASGLTVQQSRINVASENLANVSSTRTPNGVGPYMAKNVVVSSAPLAFDMSLQKYIKARDVQGAHVVGVMDSKAEPKAVYNPDHPDANEEGFVLMPNITSTQEIIDIMQASKAYEANITALNAAKTMVERAYSIGAR